MNWKMEATDKLRRYGAVRMALINIPAEIKRLPMEAESIRSARTDTVAVTGGGSKREDALINNILHRKELEVTLKQVKLWLSTTDRAMGTLSSEEKLILHRLLIYPQPNAIEQLCRELEIEQSTLYRKRDQALHRFTFALYGISEL